VRMGANRGGGWYGWLKDRVTRPTQNDSGAPKKKGGGRLVAKIPSRFLVDIDGAQGTLSCECQVIHLTIAHVLIGSQALLRKSKNKVFCTMSIGKQTVVSKNKDAGNRGKGKTKDPQQVSSPNFKGEYIDVEFDTGAMFVLSKGGASVVRIAVFQRGRMEGAFHNRLLGYAETDVRPLVELCNSALSETDQESALFENTLDILSPSGQEQVGEVVLQAKSATIQHLEEQVWERLLLLGDWNENNRLDYEEFRTVMQTFEQSSEVDEASLQIVFERARSISGDPENPSVEMKSIAKSMAYQGDGSSLSRYVKSCPVDGAQLSSDPSMGASNVLYVWLALSEGFSMESMKAGYVTDLEASRAWVMKLSEWASHPVRTVRGARGASKRLGGLRSGALAQHILVFDRSKKMIIEEIVSPVILMAMRTLYQSKVGRSFLENPNFLKKLTSLSLSEGAYRDSEDSKKEIEKFVNSFQGQLDVSSAEKPMHEYKTFNEFFYRRLKPGSRPICPGEDIVTSAADCRLHVFDSIDAATRFWIKGRNFSVAGLVGDKDVAGLFLNGSMAIFRLAPQDYHRFHSPVSGRIVSISNIPGHLLTVNPIAINSNYADVFTINKRSLMILDTDTFGRVAFVAIGATLVGSIIWSVEEDQQINKGDELGYFAFGGSTCIALFQPGQVMWDTDLLANSSRSLETLVKVGDHIGRKEGVHIPTVESESMLQAANKAADDAGILPLEDRPGHTDASLVSPLEALY